MQCLMFRCPKVTPLQSRKASTIQTMDTGFLVRQPWFRQGLNTVLIQTNKPSKYAINKEYQHSMVILLILCYGYIIATVSTYIFVSYKKQTENHKGNNNRKVIATQTFRCHFFSKQVTNVHIERCCSQTMMYH